MNKWEKEVAQSLLDSEEAAIKELERQYARALKDIEARVKMFDYDIKQLQEAINADGLDDAAKAVLKSQQQAKVYQRQYQQALKGQISGVLDNLHAQQYKTIEDYLKSCYTAGYVGTMYDIAKQGIPLVMPIDQAAVVRAVLTDSKIVEGYYQHLGVDYAKLKKRITTEVSRGIASGLSYAEIARNLHSVSGSGLYNAKRIARTEGHRIAQTSADDARRGAISRGCDVLKQWDAALDSRTRPSHARVDGEIREEDEKFSNGLMFPGDPNGSAEEVINCRCVASTRARWALDESELETLKERAAYFGLDKTESFEDFQRTYLKAAKRLENVGENGIIVSAQYPEYSRIIRDVDAVEDAKRTNPHYNKQTYVYTNNCQRCVPAWELRQRGFDVIAQPCKPLGEYDFLRTSPFSMWNFNAFDKDPLKRVQIDRTGSGKEKIIEFLKSSGNGSRVEIVVAWDYNPTEGHAFAAKNIDGEILFIDPQNGKSGKYVEAYFDRVVNGETRWLRIDNLPLAERYRSEVIANPYE